MKFNKWIPGPAAIALIALIALASVASAQTMDVFNTIRSLPIGTAGMIAVNANYTTNGPVDILGYMGRGEILINTGTNGGGMITATVESSPDQTNWTGVANYALINSTTAIIYTNQLYGSTNLICTNNILLPFTLTTPTASSAGFATPYPAPNTFTNAAGAVTVTKAGAYMIGLNLTDCQRYIHVVFTATGAATNGNAFVSAILQGSRVITP